MKSLHLEEENIIKNIRNLFRLKKEQSYTAVKDIRNVFRQEKKFKAIKGRILGDIKNLFEHEKKEETYYKPVRVSNFCSNSYIEYESNSDRNKRYLKDIINNLAKSDTWKIQLMKVNNFISSIGNDEDHVMCSKADETIEDNDKFMIKQMKL